MLHLRTITNVLSNQQMVKSRLLGLLLFTPLAFYGLLMLSIVVAMSD